MTIIYVLRSLLPSRNSKLKCYPSKALQLLSCLVCLAIDTYSSATLISSLIVSLKICSLLLKSVNDSVISAWVCLRRCAGFSATPRHSVLWIFSLGVKQSRKIASDTSFACQMSYALLEEMQNTVMTTHTFEAVMLTQSFWCSTCVLSVH